MKKSLILIFVTLFIGPFAFSGELKWYSWNEGYELAKKENKPMLVFIYASWCHVCKKMEDKTYKSNDISVMANQDFIPVKFDIEQKGLYSYNGKEYNGMELIKKLTDNKFQGIPSSLFFFPSTEKSYLEVGYQTSEEFAPVLTRYAAMK